MHKKWLLGIMLATILLIGGNKFLMANFLHDSQENMWKNALIEKDISFFENQIKSSKEEENFIKTINEYEKIIDPNISISIHTTFFSFLGLKKETSILHSHYGILEKRNGKNIFIFDTPLTALIIKKEEKSITVKNSSPVSIPLLGKTLLLPNDISGIWISKSTTLAPNETATLRFSNPIPENVPALENVSYGFKILLSDK